MYQSHSHCCCKELIHGVEFGEGMHVCGGEEEHDVVNRRCLEGCEHVGFVELMALKEVSAS